MKSSSYDVVCSSAVSIYNGGTTSLLLPDRRWAVADCLIKSDGLSDYELLMEDTVGGVQLVQKSADFSDGPAFLMGFH